jgi:5-methyltetrahydrofolate--homocysteine methyltransferase
MEDNSMFEELKASIISGDEQKATSLTREFMDKGTEPQKVLKEGLVAGMDVVGERFKAYEMWLPEVILSAKAMKAATELMKPYWEQAGGGESLGKIVIATVEGDVHDIGKNLVSMMLEAAGFSMNDLGVNAKIQEIVDAANKDNADIVGLSALLTQTMLAMKPAIKAIRGSGGKAKVIVGGSPITQEYANEVESDGFAPDALRAINLCKKLVGKS